MLVLATILLAGAGGFTLAWSSVFAVPPRVEIAAWIALAVGVVGLATDAFVFAKRANRSFGEALSESFKDAFALLRSLL